MTLKLTSTARVRVGLVPSRDPGLCPGSRFRRHSCRVSPKYDLREAVHFRPSRKFRGIRVECRELKFARLCIFPTFMSEKYLAKTSKMHKKRNFDIFGQKQHTYELKSQVQTYGSRHKFCQKSRRDFWINQRPIPRKSQKSPF